MTLAKGHKGGHREALIGLLHDRSDQYEIEPIVMGAPWLDHPRNAGFTDLMWSAFEHESRPHFSAQGLK